MPKTMSQVMRKTEIEPLDGTPEKRMFWSIINDYDIKTALTELVDNAIDTWMAKKNRGKLQVKLSFDVDRQLITLSDNAGGVPKEHLRLLVAPGGSLNSPDGGSIGIFGVGSKRAVVALAENVIIKTRHNSDQSHQIDITREWLDASEWELPAYAIPEIDPGSTVIEFSHLRKPLSDTLEQELLRHFGEVYEWFLDEDRCTILVNGQPVIPFRFDQWAFPPEFRPRTTSFQVKPDQVGTLGVEITAGLISDRDPVAENYGVYFYCNNRLVLAHAKNREFGYFVTSEAGVPHPDASLCRAIVRISGSAKLQPWNSSKTGINFSHPAFVQLRPTLIQLVAYFSSLSRRTKDDWSSKVFAYDKGEPERIRPVEPGHSAKLVLPPLPKVQKKQVDHLKARNASRLEESPWTLGLVEALAAVDLIARQRLVTGNRIAMILLDSNFEIALKEFIVHRPDLYDPKLYTDSKIAEIFARRHKVIEEVKQKVNLAAGLLDRARHYYLVRNKLIHERATVDVSPSDIANYRRVIEQILTQLFDLQFD